MAVSGPKEATVRRLFALSMNQCAFPECVTAIVDGATNTILADVCHICAQSEGGPRYVDEQTDDERHALENLILMCKVHHKVIDDPNNLARFSIDRLREIKAEHETKARVADQLPPLPNAVAEALRLSGTVYSSGAVHMDFRHTIFRVGGEGGQLGGGGGGGGILTIVGLSQLPPEVDVDLDGQRGQAPGGGGGGGGALAFVGRPIENEDVLAGLRLSGMFTANAASRDSLLNVLGAGWSYCPISQTPSQVTIRLVLIVECGLMTPTTLLRFDVSVMNPAGQCVHNQSCDIAVPSGDDLVRRTSAILSIPFQVSDLGVWSFRVESGGIELGVLPIEFRAGSPVPPT